MEGEIFRSFYCFGNFVLLAFRKETSDAKDVPPEYDYRVGRIDCVRLNKCPKQNQPKFPGTDPNVDDYHTMWPIYFYHDGSREWIEMKQIVYRFEEPAFITDIQKAYNHNLFKKRVPNSEKVQNDKIFQEGLALLKKSPHQDFQFDVRTDGVTEFGKWFNGDDSIKMLCKWEDLGKAKNIIELNSKGSNLVVDDPNFNNDPIQLMSGRAIHQLFNKNPIEIDDFIGAVYGDVKYIGRVTDKDDEKIQVLYYRERKEGWDEDRNPPKKQRRQSNATRSPARAAAMAQKSIKFKPKAKDTDWITEQRQGYIFAHFKKDEIVLDQKKNIIDFVGLGNKDPQDHIENLIADWDKWSASMRVKAMTESIENMDFM